MKLRRNNGVVPKAHAFHRFASVFLRKWLVRNQSAVEKVMEKTWRGLRAPLMVEASSRSLPMVATSAPVIPVRATFATSMTAEEAARHAYAWAKDLVARTTFIRDGVMAKDAEGASAATYVPLVNYSTMDFATIPLDVHRSAIEVLRVHSGRQVNRADWESAHAALQAEAVARGLEEVPVRMHIFAWDKSPDSFKDGDYIFSKETGLKVHFKFRRGGIKVSDLLKPLGLPRDAYTWEKFRGEFTGFIFVQPEYAAIIAEAVKEHYPLMAQALLQNAPIYLTMLEKKSAEKVAPPEKAAPTRETGTVDGNFWMLAGDKTALFLWPSRALDPKLRDERGISQTVSKKTGKPFWIVKLFALPRLVTILGTVSPLFADALVQLFPEEVGKRELAYGDRPDADPMLPVLARAGFFTELEGAARRYAEEVAEDLRRVLPRGLIPYEFQQIGVACAKLAGYRCGLFDDQGLGKTIQALGCLALDPSLLPALVVCPATVLYNWEREAKKWLPNVPTWVLDEGKAQLPPEDFRGIVITTWSLQDRFVDALKGRIRTVIADEAHYAKNFGTGRSEALRDMALSSPHCLLLTGTPMINGQRIELWHLLFLLGPNVFRKKTEFGLRYTNAQPNRFSGGYDYVGEKNTEELHRVLDQWLVRRMKTDVLTQLPPKTRASLAVTVDDKAMRAYDKAVNSFDAWLEQRAREKAKALMTSGELQKMTGKVLTEWVNAQVQRSLKSEALVQMGALRQILGLAKVPVAVDFIQNLAAQGEPCIVLIEHHEVKEALEAALTEGGLRVVDIDGSVAAKNRQKAVDSFQDGSVDVLIGSQAAREGITLTRSANVWFHERWWQPGAEEQGEDRAYRIGQDRPVTIWYPYVPGTFDEDMAAVLDSKRGTVRRTIGASSVQEDGASIEGIEGGMLAAFLARKGAKGKK